MSQDMLDVLDHRFVEAKSKTALVIGDEELSYDALRRAIFAWEERLDTAGITPGDVVMLKADFGRDGIGALFALMKRRAITILLAPSSFEKEEEFAQIGAAQMCIDADKLETLALAGSGQHPLYDQLRADGDAGIVLFSSGSSGTSKGTVHSAQRLLEKFRAPGKDLRTLAFLLFDHIAGLDTLFYSLANTSTLILPRSRTPSTVCELIATHRVEVLPTAPSFLNLMLLSGAHQSHDLSSLRIITYGSEMMPESLLKRLSEALPNVRLIQKYGTSETGAMPTKSKSNTSTWLKLGGDGFRWRERDGRFEIKAKTAMVGYLNADDPFTDDGWFQTGDRIETDGEYVRFLGRDSDIINVGGQKVYPAEVEALLLDLPEVSEVSVHGEPHAILGSAVVAKIRPAHEIQPAKLRVAVRQHLSGKLESYKIPQKIKVVQDSLVTSRFKQVRRSGN